MIAGFAHMNDYWIGHHRWVEDIGFDVVVPPKPNKRSFEFGLEHSPEFVCLPFKVNLGDWKNALDMGAEIIHMTTDHGPCRYGYYGYLGEEILNRLGYDFTMHVFYHADIPAAYRSWKSHMPSLTFFKFVRATLKMFKFHHATDRVHELARLTRPYEKRKGDSERALKHSLDRLANAVSKSDLRVAKKANEEEFKKVPVDRSRDVVKLGLVGEIFLVLEPFVNQDIERMLGQMGVEVHRQISEMQYLYHQLNYKNWGVKGERQIEKRAGEYCPEDIGAHGQQSIGDAKLYYERGFDGVVHVYPFTCLPEITAYTMLHKMSRDLEFPVISFSMDQQTGRAGLETRLEAFIDMIKRKKAHPRSKIPTFEPETIDVKFVRRRKDEGIPGPGCGVCQYQSRCNK